jgi:hypothetical protein
MRRTGKAASPFTSIRVCGGGAMTVDPMSVLPYFPLRFLPGFERLANPCDPARVMLDCKKACLNEDLS